jgi:glycosyltransferase involved in cell wall biosynthesis
MNKKRILLHGPEVNVENAYFGGGAGGMVRNMAQYLNGYSSSEFRLQPCFHSVRPAAASRLSFLKRFWCDTSKVFRDTRSADGLHIVSQYRTAIYREFAVVLVSLMRGVPVLYEIKAGAFITWLETCRPWERAMAGFILRRAKVVICEGRVYVDYLKTHFGIEAHYAPNFVLDGEIPPDIQPKLMSDQVCVLFVGYCYEGKGVFELVEGCELAAKQGVPVELTLAGHEDESFTRFLDDRIAKGLSCSVNRMGRMNHDDVLRLFASNDVFCMPTRHSGEGHTNTVNEAMMMGMVIVTTRHGFLEDVLQGDVSYFLEHLSAADIADCLKTIHQDRDEARRRAGKARARLLESFTSEAAFANLTTHYKTLTERD